MTAREKSEKTCMAAIVNPLTEADLRGIEAFMGRLNVFVADHHKIHADTDIQGLEDFFLRFEPVREAWEAYLKAHAPGYNVFEILMIRHYEARVHTPFLVNLLNPNGSHMQGDLFYQSFLEKVLGEKGVFEQSEGLSVHGEYSAGDLGRIDILIENRRSAVPFCIIIENKIYATDQENQLERYHQFATERRAYNAENYRLLYLNLFPDKAVSDYTMQTTNATQLSDIGILRIISYQNEILPWLKWHLDTGPAMPPVLNETIKQYVLTLQYLLS
jgi:hypothetical protein